jgi:hypothetical protein
LSLRKRAAISFVLVPVSRPCISSDAKKSIYDFRSSLFIYFSPSFWAVAVTVMNNAMSKDKIDNFISYDVKVVIEMKLVESKLSKSFVV